MKMSNHMVIGLMGKPKVIYKLLILPVPSVTNRICGCTDDTRHLQFLLVHCALLEVPGANRKVYNVNWGFCCTFTGMDLNMHPHNHYVFNKSMEYCCGYLHRRLFFLPISTLRLENNKYD